MDLTNGRRVGYHWFTEYGNIFLENRYTDWGNYYPYKTMRNLWQLSRYTAPEIHKGAILPVGEEPSGRSWTGFQSISDDKHGHLIVYRELTPEVSGLLKTWLPAGTKIKCKTLMGSGTDFTTMVDTDGRIKITLPQPNSFAVYEYTASPKNDKKH